MINGFNYLSYAAIGSFSSPVITNTSHENCWVQVLELYYYCTAIAKKNYQKRVTGYFRSCFGLELPYAY